MVQQCDPVNKRKRLEKSIINNIKHLLRVAEHSQTPEDKIRNTLVIINYNIENLFKLRYNACKKYFKGVYDKCLEFENSYTNRYLDNFSGELPCEFRRRNAVLKRMLMPVVGV